MTRLSGSASTGQPPSLRHPATAGAAHSGGSVIERNFPPSAVMMACAATSDVGSASSRRRGTEPRSVRFSTRTWSFRARHGPGTSVARIVTAPASGSRRRTTSSSRSSPPSTVNARVTPSPNSAAASAAASISRSTASSQISAAELSPPEVRRWTCRNRSRTRTAGCPPCSSTHSARVKLVSDSSAAAYPGAITTPNCQRLWFFCAEAR